MFSRSTMPLLKLPALPRFLVHHSAAITHSLTHSLATCCSLSRVSFNRSCVIMAFRMLVYDVRWSFNRWQLEWCDHYMETGACEFCLKRNSTRGENKCNECACLYIYIYILINFMDTSCSCMMCI